MASALETPIRLMHIVDILAVAGMEYGVIKQVNRLDPRVFSPSICCLRSRMEATRSLLNPRVPVYELHKRPGLDLGVAFRLASLFRNRDVEVVHSHNWSTFLHAVLAATLARTPVLIHGEHGREDRKVPARQLRLSRVLAKRVDHLVAVCSDLAGELVRDWKMNPAKVSAIANGVDLDRFSSETTFEGLRKELGLTVENRVVLNIGRLRPVKDPQTLLRAFAVVHEQLNGARLLFVGSDQGTGMQEELEALTNELGIREAVLFVGVRHDIPCFLGLCDVYVNSSIYEGMSNTILEAMASAKPVVATDVGGNSELVKHGRTGYLVPAGDDRILASRILELLTHPQAIRAMGTAGRRTVEINHQMSGMVQKYVELYRESLLRYRSRKARPASEQVKKAAAHAFRFSGANYVKWHSRNNQLTIIGYHRVLPLHQAAEYPFSSMVMPKDLFEAQIAYVAKHYCPLGLPEAMRLLHAGKLPRRAVVATFDDGYRDNYEHAWPILRRFNVPASFFVVTDVVDGKVGLWWDEVAGQVEAILRGRPLRFSEEARHLPQWVLSVFSRSTSAEDTRSIARELVARLNHVSRAERRTVLDLLHALAKTESETSRLMLSWEQVRELHDSGMTIGSHTVSHEFLDEVDEGEGWRQIRESVTTMEQRLSGPVSFFAYPAGRYGRNSSALLRRAGIEAAITARPGSNGAMTDMYRLKRYDAGYSCLRSGFSSAVLDMELQGWLCPFRALSTHQPYS